MQSNGKSNPEAIPEVPKVPERIVVNTQCADVEDWDDKAFPLMVERAVPNGQENPFTTLSIPTIDLLVALLTKPLKLMTPRGVLECAPVEDENPDLKPLVQWLRAASMSVKRRRGV